MGARLPTPVTDNWDWQIRGMCRGLDSGLFFPPDGERAPARAAREILAKGVCRVCPVLAQCRRHALSVREPHGVWGGLSVSERGALTGRDPHGVRVAAPEPTCPVEPPQSPEPARNNRAGSAHP